ncbi:MAG: tRNA uridine-5-carboxymethylaminomethyl(34) synthesis GTPase MnmE [Gammaproteobacteria bacterium]|nr:tRNA uridine-5-carboxymethylaminomethyl(34) synthesis GTPase MnmE [Gammaproteobacteria bacterium]
MSGSDTIAALATAPGRGGIGVVRVSGARVAEIARELVGQLPSPRLASYLPFLEADGSHLDQGLVIRFVAPHSYTGEDVLELQGHGGPVVMDMLLKRILALGVRVARPGEFTERAFLNGKMDLAQAEAVSDLIESGSEQAARAALSSMQGAFSLLVKELLERLIHLRIYVEAALDFPEEEIDFLADETIYQQLDELKKALLDVQRSARQGQLLKEGMSVVIVGRPNVGKSSLLNRLAGHDAAIVTEIAGTTRDVLREQIHLDGLPLHVIDTAGLRETDDLVEKEGIRRARAEINKADRILVLIDDEVGLSAEVQQLLDSLPSDIPRDRIHNKIDLSGRSTEIKQSEAGTEIWLSAKADVGIELLREHLKSCMGYRQNSEGNFTARRRHLHALGLAQKSVLAAEQVLRERGAGELAAEDLLLAQRYLNEITGEFSSDDLLGCIFSSFCIGK